MEPKTKEDLIESIKKDICDIDWEINHNKNVYKQLIAKQTMLKRKKALMYAVIRELRDSDD